ncbi:hypothetical protein NY78_1116 [Desulfovibrio sp. TomC]|nr:hypothetical protein NY78_1116 [Desulfovibrio sp. TomC]
MAIAVRVWRYAAKASSAGNSQVSASGLVSPKRSSNTTRKGGKSRNRRPGATAAHRAAVRRRQTRPPRTKAYFLVIPHR